MTKEEILSKNSNCHINNVSIIDHDGDHVLDAMEEYANLRLSEQQSNYEKKVKEIINELNKCFKDGNEECDGAHCQGCWKDIVRNVINNLTSQTN